MPYNTQVHHSRPLSINGPDTNQNKFRVHQKPHTNIHKEQDVDYKVRRQFWKKVNGIMIYNESYRDAETHITKKYFRNIGNNTKDIITKQQVCLIKEINTFKRLLREEPLNRNTIPNWAFTEGLVEELFEVKLRYTLFKVNRKAEGILKKKSNMNK